MLKIESFSNLPFKKFLIVVNIVNIFCGWFYVLLLYLLPFSKQILIVFKIVKLIVAKCLIRALGDRLMLLKLREALSFEILFGLIWIPIGCRMAFGSMIVFLLFFWGLFMQIQKRTNILLMRNLFGLALTAFFAIFFIFMLSMASFMLLVAF